MRFPVMQPVAEADCFKSSAKCHSGWRLRVYWMITGRPWRLVFWNQRLKESGPPRSLINKGLLVKYLRMLELRGTVWEQLLALISVKRQNLHDWRHITESAGDIFLAKMAGWVG